MDLFHTLNGCAVIIQIGNIDGAPILQIWGCLIQGFITIPGGFNRISEQIGPVSPPFLFQV